MRRENSHFYSVHPWLSPWTNIEELKGYKLHWNSVRGTDLCRIELKDGSFFKDIFVSEPGEFTRDFQQAIRKFVNDLDFISTYGE